MSLVFVRLAYFVSLFTALCAVPATAENAQSNDNLVLEENAEERINFSGKLRMLSQRIPSAACHLSQGIDVEGSSALLEAAPIEFEKILTALEFGGDPDLNIKNPETRPKTLKRIHELRKEWEPLKAAANKVSQGTATEDDLQFVLTQNMAVLGAAVRLVPELVKQYSNPNAVPYDRLLLIDISGRQRMLTQKMSKEACIMGTSHQTSTTANDLKGTMTIFESSLNALRFGLPELSLNPPPNKGISDGLEVVLTNWNSVEPILENRLAGNALTSNELKNNFQGLNTTMANMNKVVGMYTQAAKPSS